MWGSTTNVRGAGCANDGTCCLLSTAESSEMSVQATQYHIPNDGNLHGHCHENLIPATIYNILSTCDTYTHRGTSAVPLTLGIQKSPLSRVDCGIVIEGTDFFRQM